MKNILIWGLSDSNHLGGIERYLLHLASSLDKKKYKLFFLVVRDKKPCFHDELLKLGCEFIFVTSRRKSIIKNKKEIEKVFNENNFDIVHCNLSSLSYIEPCLAASKHNIKLIIHSHNSFFTGNYFSMIMHVINYVRIKKIKAEKIAVSKKAGKWMFGSENFITINNSIDVTKFIYNEKSRKKIRKELSIDDNTTVIINVASFKLEKNHLFLFDLYSKLIKNNNKKYLLLLAGDGERRKILEDRVNKLGINDEVMFLGTVENIGDLLSASDIFVLPSLFEGYPIALIEAECNGLPCVVSDRITSESIIKGLCSALPLNNQNEWINAIKWSNNDERKNNSKYASNWLDNKHTKSTQIEDIYEKL